MVLNRTRGQGGQPLNFCWWVWWRRACVECDLCREAPYCWRLALRARLSPFHTWSFPHLRSETMPADEEPYSPRREDDALIYAHPAPQLRRTEASLSSADLNRGPSAGPAAAAGGVGSPKFGPPLVPLSESVAPPLRAEGSGAVFRSSLDNPRTHAFVALHTRFSRGAVQALSVANFIPVLDGEFPPVAPHTASSAPSSCKCKLQGRTHLPPTPAPR
jgi:hypothetical protein